jgi:SHS2 domain-containing protein
MRYEILEHTADLKIRIFGKTKEELFLNALLAMAELMKPELEKGMKAKREIKVKSADLPALLVDFLNEALYLSQSNKEVYNGIEFNKFFDPSADSGQAEIEGIVSGGKAVRFGEDIKAVTHHNLEVRQKDDGSWEAIILFDI